MGAWPGLAETPIVLDTLNDYREMKLELHAHCSCCGAHRQLDLDTQGLAERLADRFGRIAQEQVSAWQGCKAHQRGLEGA